MALFASPDMWKPVKKTGSAANKPTRKDEAVRRTAPLYGLAILTDLR